MAWADLGWDGDGGEDVEALFSCLCAASHADREAMIRLSHTSTYLILLIALSLVLFSSRAAWFSQVDSLAFGVHARISCEWYCGIAYSVTRMLIHTSFWNAA